MISKSSYSIMKKMNKEKYELIKSIGEEAYLLRVSEMRKNLITMYFEIMNTKKLNFKIVYDTCDFEKFFVSYPTLREGVIRMGFSSSNSLINLDVLEKYEAVIKEFDEVFRLKTSQNTTLRR